MMYFSVVSLALITGLIASAAAFPQTNTFTKSRKTIAIVESSTTPAEVEPPSFTEVVKRASSVVNIRSAKPSDTYAIACLFVDAFEREFKPWEILPLLKARQEQSARVSRRITVAAARKLKHSLIVAEDKKTTQIVGVAEVGFLPPPPEFEVEEEQEKESQETADDQQQEEELSQQGATNEEGGDSIGRNWHGVEVYEAIGPQLNKTSQRVEVPYLANLSVDRSMQRQGIGAALVMVAQNLVGRKWKRPYMFVTVESDNPRAVALYEKLGFKFLVSKDHINKKGEPVQLLHYQRELEWNGMEFV
mmetsp:Transcript_23760/g.34548  ORF Transcript_23760/g.34548 Transcript_23760/m.34548 type:complete len:304 (-) Transcript_23760:100-1011(-)